MLASPAIQRTMTISEIIKSDADRLFIVDPECYIIYTGETPDDDKPFIRIGNWPGLTPQVIPLIENVIVTDESTGNPFFEQYNIVLGLSSNKYIGTRNSVKQYLDFQKIFGIDLSKSGIVDIEKDIPELSGERQFAGRNQFIGIFYRDGNFKIVHENTTVINMDQMAKEFPDYSRFHDLLSKNIQAGRYDGSGMVIVDSKPLFYSKGMFISYLFPEKYFKAFSELSINPEKIEYVLYPIKDFSPLARFIKWCAGKKIAVKIFSDHAEVVRGFKKIFPGFNVTIKNFSRMSFAAEGAVVKNFENTQNIKIRYTGIKPEFGDLTIAFVFEDEGMHAIIKERPDAIVVRARAFEKSFLLLKSYELPVLIIDDGDDVINKIRHYDKLIVRQNIQYEFFRTDDIDQFFEIAMLNSSMERDMDSPNVDSLEKMLIRLSVQEIDFEEIRKALNMMSYARMVLNHTTDRILSSKIRSLLEKHNIRLKEKFSLADEKNYMIRLVYYRNGIYEFIEKGSGQNPSLLLDDPDALLGIESGINADAIKLYTRIRNDRARLMNLLKLLNPPARGTDIIPAKEIARKIPERKKLRPAINESGQIRISEKMKEEIFDDRREQDIKITSAKAAYQKEPVSAYETGKAADGERDQTVEYPKKRTRLKLILPVVILAFILLLAGSLYLIWNRGTDLNSFSPRLGTDENINAGKEKTSDMPEKKADGTLEKDYRKKIQEIPSDISDTEIFRYVNRIAGMNGYGNIPYTRRGKNPDWIFPSNVILMPDGEKITIKKGDTLWFIAREKLTKVKRHDKR